VEQLKQQQLLFRTTASIDHQDAKSKSFASYELQEEDQCAKEA
jgi:hypothetical protein